MKNIIIILIILVSCSNDNYKSEESVSFKLRALFQKMNLTCDLNKTNDIPKYDINQILLLFKNIKLINGYKLNYQYKKEFSEYISTQQYSGYPKIYAYKIDNPSKIIFNDFEYIICDGSSNSYVEFTIFHIMKEQFFLYWHAKYNNDFVVLNKNDIKYLINEIELEVKRRNISVLYKDEMPKSLISEIKKYEIITKVEDSNDKLVSVYISVFNLCGGIDEEKYSINRRYPHKIKLLERKNVIDMEYCISY